MTAAQLRDTLLQIALASSDRERLRLVGTALMQHAGHAEHAATETIPGLLVTEFTPWEDEAAVAHRASQPAAQVPDDDPLIAFRAQYPLAVLALRGI